MKGEKIFKKFYTRSIPLAYVQAWFLSEKDGLKKITGGKMYFNPLFIYKKGKGIEIYYDVNNHKTDPNFIIERFSNFQEFKKLRNKYFKEYSKIKEIAESQKRITPAIISLITSFWAKMVIMIILARELEKGKKDLIFKSALDARKRTEKAAHLKEEILLRLIRDSRVKEADENLVSLDEILKGKLPGLESMRARKRGYIFFEGKIYENISLNNFQKIKNFKILSAKINRDTFLKGETANKGKVRGEVKIIFAKDDVSKVKMGNILITPMTRPDLMPAIRRAAAIVTDEGGITCHAAIAAREFKKPCIVGTKIATQLFKDGNKVEVDANKGIIKIL